MGVVAGESPLALAATLRAAREGVDPSIAFQLISHSVERELVTRDAPSKAIRNRAEIRALGYVVLKAREAPNDVVAASVAVVRLERLQDRAERQDSDA